MTRLKENLELCLDAIAYAKGQAPRSANQTYYKTLSPKKKYQKRYTFLLGMTRRTGYSYQVDDQGTITGVGKDRQRKERRTLIEQLLRSNQTKQAIERALDQYIDQWGEDYFWDGANFKTIKQITIAGEGGQLGPDSWWTKQIIKYGGFTLNELTLMDGQGFGMAQDITEMRQSAASAAQAGVGNCDEKAQLAGQWIYLHAYGDGRNLAMCYLDPEHGGIFGRVHYDDDGNPHGGGDHVFAVYDCTPTPGVNYNTYKGKISDMGENAIIVDGWMNDAYPAKHHSLSLFGSNYRRNYMGEIINLKQSVVRDMVCISYRKNIKYRWNYTLAQGPNHGDPAPDRAQLSRGTAQYKGLPT